LRFFKINHLQEIPKHHFGSALLSPASGRPVPRSIHGRGQGQIGEHVRKWLMGLGEIISGALYRRLRRLPEGAHRGREKPFRGDWLSSSHRPWKTLARFPHSPRREFE